MSSSKPTLAFFGATGGCTAMALALALKEGYTATALARTPSKLTDLLEKTHNISSSTISTNLTIIQGSMEDASAVRKAIAPSNQLADFIISGVGAAPKIQMSLNPIAMDNPHIVENGMRTVLDVIRTLQSEGITKKPSIITISTTGISTQKNDVPAAYYGMYHWILSVPHKDKKAMEDLAIDAAQPSDKGDSLIKNFVIVRPTLLVVNAFKGLEKVRVGWEHPREQANKAAGALTAPGPAKGYGISKADVGNWIFQKGIKENEVWANKAVSLTF